MLFTRFPLVDKQAKKDTLEVKRNSAGNYAKDITSHMREVNKTDHGVVFAMPWYFKIPKFETEAERIAEKMLMESDKKISDRMDSLEKAMKDRDKILLEAIDKLNKATDDKKLDTRSAMIKGHEKTNVNNDEFPSLPEKLDNLNLNGFEMLDSPGGKRRRGNDGTPKPAPQTKFDWNEVAAKKRNGGPGQQPHAMVRAALPAEPVAEINSPRSSPPQKRDGLRASFAIRANAERRFCCCKACSSVSLTPSEKGCAKGRGRSGRNEEQGFLQRRLRGHSDP